MRRRRRLASPIEDAAQGFERAAKAHAALHVAQEHVDLARADADADAQRQSGARSLPSIAARVEVALVRRRSAMFNKIFVGVRGYGFARGIAERYGARRVIRPSAWALRADPAEGERGTTKKAATTYGDN